MTRSKWASQSRDDESHDATTTNGPASGESLGRQTKQEIDDAQSEEGNVSEPVQSGVLKLP